MAAEPSGGPGSVPGPGPLGDPDPGDPDPGHPDPGHPDPGDPDRAIDRAWAELDARWEDPQAHDAFVGLCHALGRLPEAGRRYRQVRDRHPARSEEARHRIDRLLHLVTQTLELTRTAPPDTAGAHRRLLFFALGLCLLLVGSALWAWLR